MTSVVIVVSPPGAAGRSIRSVLHDFTSLELASEFLWVESASIDGFDASDVVAEHVTSVSAKRTGIGSYLANLGRPGVLRVVALNFVGDPESLLDEETLGRFVEQLRPFAAVADGAGKPDLVALNCVVPRPGRGGWRTDCAWIGWNNLVIAPQDAKDPAAAPEFLGTETDDARFATHAATAVAGLAAMWLGLNTSAFDRRSLDSFGERYCRVTRSFYRRLDWADAASAVIARLAGSADRIPTPYSGTAALERLHDPAAACSYVASAVLEKHKDLFEAPTARPPKARERIGPIATLKLFGAFLWGSLVMAPEAWVRSLISKGASRTAQRIQHTFFGDDESKSRFEVVVSGFNSNGEFVPAARAASEARELTSRLRPLLSMAEPRFDYLAPFWHDFVSGALTLADASEGRGLEPVHAGSAPGYVSRPAAIAPSVEDVFALPQRLAAYVGIDEEVHAYDVRAQLAIEGRLASLVGSDKQEARDADRCRAAFAEWVLASEKTYVVRVGKSVAEKLTAVQAELSTLADQLDEVAGESDFIAAVEPLKRAHKHLRRWGVGLLVLLAVLVGLVLAVVISVVIFAVVAALAVGAFFSACIRSFMKQQRRLFQLVNRRTAEEERYLTIRLADATRRINALTVMQAQYECWAPIIARFLEAPYERVRETTSSMPTIVGQLPRALVIGRAVPSEDVVTRVATQLEPAFQAGWLEKVWNDRLTASGEACGLRGDEQAIREAYYRDEARESDSPLRITSTMAALAPGRRESETALGEAIQKLAGSSRTLLFEALTGRIASGQEQGDTPGFIADLTEPVARRDFRPDLFTPMARGGGGAPQAITEQAVIENVVDYRSFVRAVLVVDFSRPLLPDELQLTERDGATAESRPRTGQAAGRASVSEPGPF